MNMLQSKLLEEVVAFVVDEYEGREVLHADLPDRLHAEVRVFDALDALDALVGKDGGRTADGAEIEAAMLLAGIGHGLRAIALCDHYHRAAVILEQIHVRIHAVSSRRSHGAASHSFRSLGRASIEHRVILEILWQILSPVKPLFQAGMCYVSGHDDSPIQAQASRNRICRKLSANLFHRAVKVHYYSLALTCVA